MKLLNMDAITRYLPKDWKQSCLDKYKLIQRAREIKTPEELLMLNLLYVTEGESLQITSAFLKLAGLSMNKNAVHKRFFNSCDWLKYLSENVCKDHALIAPKPEWLGDKNICLVDGSEMKTKGSKTGTHRLHYMFDLFRFECRQCELTTIKDGEKLQKFNLQPNDIVIADRGFGRITSITHALESGADFILRLKSTAFHLYDQDGKLLDLKQYVAQLDSLQSTDVHCFYKHENVLKPIRICILKKDDEAIEKTQQTLHRTAQKRQKNIQAHNKWHHDYIVVATNLTYTNEQIHELYRARWQVELVFKRLKSLMDFGNVPCKNSKSILSWFYAKLLIAAICEAQIKEVHFSPKV